MTNVEVMDILQMERHVREDFSWWTLSARTMSWRSHDRRRESSVGTTCMGRNNVSHWWPDLEKRSFVDSAVWACTAAAVAWKQVRTQNGLA